MKDSITKIQNENEKSLIDIKDLGVTYNKGKDNEFQAIKNVDLKIYKGEYIIIYGPSGCGKSTLLYAIAGLQSPTKGDVFVGGMNIATIAKGSKEMVDFHRNEMSIIFQAFHLIPSLSVFKNVLLPAIFANGPIKERNEKAKGLLERFGISDQLKKLPSQLSGGQKQRVAIARSLMNNPGILLADEPVGNLDVESTKNVLKILKELNEKEGRTIILVTHDSRHLDLANRVYYMENGEVIKEVVNRDKRPKKAREESVAEGNKNIPTELELLMRSFKQLTREQIGSSFIPFKAKELLKYLLAELTSTQVQTAENFVKDLLSNNIDLETLAQKLDYNYEEGGANWNKQRAHSFSIRVGEVLGQAKKIREETDIKKLGRELAEYLVKTVKIELKEKQLIQMGLLLELRLNNEIDGVDLRKSLDLSKSLGGVGLYNITAEHISEEVEMIMLLGYDK